MASITARKKIVKEAGVEIDELEEQVAQVRDCRVTQEISHQETWVAANEGAAIKLPKRALCGMGFEQRHAVKWLH